MPLKSQFITSEICGDRASHKDQGKSKFISKFPLDEVRLLNVILPRQTRGCYWRSEREDEMHMDMLCASMYREAVYIARRGFFSRDLFLEHVALCGMLGYEEFYRRHWFRKTVSWIDANGCTSEFPNFEINRTRLQLAQPAVSRLAAKKMRMALRKNIVDGCHHHPMGLQLIVLTHGARHAAHFMKS